MKKKKKKKKCNVLTVEVEIWQVQQDSISPLHHAVIYKELEDLQYLLAFMVTPVLTMTL